MEIQMFHSPGTSFVHLCKQFMQIYRLTNGSRIPGLFPEFQIHTANSVFSFTDIPKPHAQVGRVPFPSPFLSILIMSTNTYLPSSPS